MALSVDRLETLRPFLKRVAWDVVPHAPRQGLFPYQVITPEGSDKGLFTGYFEPVLRGSFAKKPPFVHPVYAPPPELKVGSPHVTRADVDQGALQNRNLELLYVDDAVDLFFAHVQGSAAIKMQEGFVRRIGFAAKSGHSYTAIGKTLKDMGALQSPITMQSIKNWLREHPELQQEVMCSNASFIFFRLLEGAGPVGASGTVLVPEQSLAVDDTIWPYGIEVIISTTDPVDNTKPFIRCMRTHDCGSAIKGAIRGDIYFGTQDDGADCPALRAGVMNAYGSIWALLPE